MEILKNKQMFNVIGEYLSELLIILVLGSFVFVPGVVYGDQVSQSSKNQACSAAENNSNKVDNACSGNDVGDPCNYNVQACTSNLNQRANCNATKTEVSCGGICSRGRGGGIYCDFDKQDIKNCTSGEKEGDACIKNGKDGTCQRAGGGNRRNNTGPLTCVTSGNNDTVDNTGGNDNTDGDKVGGGQEDDSSSDVSPSPQTIEIQNPLSADSIPQLVGDIVRGILGLLGTVALLIIVYAGIKYMTAINNPNEAKQNIQIITNAVIGLIIIMASFLIVQYVISALVN